MRLDMIRPVRQCAPEMVDRLGMPPKRMQQRRKGVMDAGMVRRQRKGLFVTGDCGVRFPGAGEDRTEAPMRFGPVLVDRDRLREVVLRIVDTVGGGQDRAQPQKRPIVRWTLDQHQAEQLLRVGEISPLLQLPGHLERELGPGFRLGSIRLGCLGLGYFRFGYLRLGCRRLACPGIGDRGFADQGAGDRGFGICGTGIGRRRPRLAFAGAALLPRGRRALDVQCFQKRPEPRAIKARSPDRARVNRLAHLDQACGVDRTPGLMKGQASLVPIQPAMRDKTPGLPCKIADDVLILHFENPSRRQHGAPVGHHRLIGPVVTADFPEVVGERLVFREQQREARQTGIDGMPLDVNDSGLRKRQVNQAHEQEVRRHLVDDAILPAAALGQAFHIGLAELLQVVVGQFAEKFGKNTRRSFRNTGRRRHEILDLAGAENARVTGQDLFDKARARARHAQHEDRHVRVRIRY